MEDFHLNALLFTVYAVSTSYKSALDTKTAITLSLRGRDSNLLLKQSPTTKIVEAKKTSVYIDMKLFNKMLLMVNLALPVYC